jgi:hypothetical protein
VILKSAKPFQPGFCISFLKQLVIQSVWSG